MNGSADPFRRWLGVAFLTVAVAMLTAGLTFLEGRLKSRAFVAYWSLCFLFTGLAAVTALWDAMVVRRRSRQAQRRLIDDTFNTIEEVRRRRGPRPKDREE